MFTFVFFPKKSLPVFLCAAFFSVLCLHTSQFLWGFEKHDLRRSIVSIKVKATRAAYDNTGTWRGTGFLCDGKNGLIITNQHVTGYGVVATYEVTFFDGTKVSARLLYRDPWYDFAFLAVEASETIPRQARPLDYFTPAKQGATVHMMGNNQGRDFSYQKGTITNLYNDVGFMPQPAFSTVLNSQGGSSGSPLVDDNGRVMGLNYGGSGRGQGFAIHSAVLGDALDALRAQKKPPRFHCGFVVRLKSLSGVMRFHKFPSEVAKSYMRKDKKAKGRVLMVVGTLKGSPAEGVLQNGDVLWRVCGKEVGASAVTLEACLNASGGKPVVVEFYRKGVLLKKQIGTYDLHKTVVNRLLVFAGGTLFEADDHMRWQFGVKPRQLMVRNVMPNSAFGRGLLPSFTNLSNEGRLSPVRLCLFTNQTFDSFLASIPKLVKQRAFDIQVRWLEEFNSGYSGVFFMTDAPDTCSIMYDNVHNTLPELITYAFNEKAWRTSAILCHGDTL